MVLLPLHNPGDLPRGLLRTQAVRRKLDAPHVLRVKRQVGNGARDHVLVTKSRRDVPAQAGSDRLGRGGQRKPSDCSIPEGQARKNALRDLPPLHHPTKDDIFHVRTVKVAAQYRHNMIDDAPFALLRDRKRMDIPAPIAVQQRTGGQ